MASGSSARGNALGSKPFDFASDDILCSYEDYGNQEGTNGTHSDSAIAHDKEFHKSRMSRLSVFPASTYSPPEESSFNQGVISAVDNTVKKHTDNVMRFLEGVSSRLSQLELYCYNLDKSIGEMRSDLSRDRQESESKLASLEKHVQEVHRSVQILRDKQELADTQKELAKLQLAQKEGSTSSKVLKTEERGQIPSETTPDASTESHDQKLALVPHQAAPPPPLPQQTSMPPPSTLPTQTGPQVQPQGYFMQPPPQMNNPSQPAQPHYLPNQPQVQELARLQAQPQINQGPQIQAVSPYQQQWPQQLQQAPQQPIVQPQNRTSPQLLYPPYMPGQSNPPSADLAPGSIPLQVPYSVQSQPSSAGPEVMSYAYGTSGKPIQQQSAQHHKTGYGGPSGDGYMPGGVRPAHPSGNAYMIFNGEGGRNPHYQQGPYPQNLPPRLPSPNIGSQSARSHPYNELIEKLVSMGYRGEHVVGVIQRLEESGQPVDFNSVLDRLNGGSQRGWSG